MDLSYIDRFIELGILALDADDRLTKGDVRKSQMARTLETAGISLEGLATGLAQGHLTLNFMDAPIYERFATFSDETFEQVASADTGVRFNEIGPVELKGISGPVRLHAAHRAG